jgi:hypothetical protein
MTDHPAEPAAVSLQDEQRRQHEQIIQGAILGPAPKFYINGYGFAQTAADLSVVLQLHSQPIGVVNMSYTTAKSLLVDLTTILEKFEKSTGDKIKTFAELNSKMVPTIEDKTGSAPPPSRRRRTRL